MSVSLPVNPNTNNATVGKDFMLYINTGTATTPVWTRIGGQRNSNLKRTASSVDVSDKTSGGWGATKAGIRQWSFSLDGLVMLSDDDVNALEMAFSSGVEVNLKFQYPNQQYRTGWASITELSIDNKHDGAASLTGTLDGNGVLGDLVGNSITPISATMSKGAAADVTFSITPTTQTVSGVTVDGSAITVSTNYTYSSGTLTLKSTYLSTLSSAAHTVVITCSTDNSLTVQVLITA